MAIHGRRGKNGKLIKKQAGRQRLFLFKDLANLSTAHTQACPRRLCKNTDRSRPAKPLAASGSIISKLPKKQAADKIIH